MKSKTKRYLKQNFKSDNTFLPVERRDFLKILGGGIVISFSMSNLFVRAQSRRSDPVPNFNAFLRVGEDGRVTCFTGKVEYGQGIITSLPQMLADELEVALNQVDMIMGDTDLCPYDIGTFGSLTTRAFGPTWRAAAAEAKAVLIELAAEKLELPIAQLVASEGMVFDKKNKKKSVTYAQLTKGKKIAREIKEKPAVEGKEDFTLVGKSLKRADALQKVTGAAKYTSDVILPGMVYASILRPPAHGVELISVDTSGVKIIDGVEIVRDGNLIAVLHQYPDVAREAVKKIKAEYGADKNPADDKNIFERMLKADTNENISQDEGNLKTGEKISDIIVESEYLNSYVAHAPIETHTATAKIENDKITVWASSQTPFSLKEEIAEQLGFEEQNVRVIVPFIGGGFGGKIYNQQGVEAARLAKLSGKPVQLIWTREEEFMYDWFRPAAVVKIKSGVTNAGRISLWDYKVYFAGERGSEHFYDIPHYKTASYEDPHGAETSVHPFATGAWRAPGNNTNTHARESQINIMAYKAGMDPLEFRLKNMKDERMIKILKSAAVAFGWTPINLPSGKGHGIACGYDAGTYVALIAEVDVNKETGHVQVNRLVCAQDMGLVVNPQGATIQTEGGVTMGLGYALTEEVHFKGGQVLDVNFGDYTVPTFSWTPKIECIFVDTGITTPKGGGEPAIITVGGALANAIFDASGARLYQMPMTPERVLNAINGKG